MSYRLILSYPEGWKKSPQTSPLRFDTDVEALSFGRNFLEPPQSVESWDVEQADLPPNYSYHNQKLVKL